MNISFGEILIIVLVALLFYKPNEIKGLVSSIFKMKKDIENEIEEMSQNTVQKVEFFEDKTQLQENNYFENKQ